MSTRGRGDKNSLELHVELPEEAFAFVLPEPRGGSEPFSSVIAPNALEYDGLASPPPSEQSQTALVPAASSASGAAEDITRDQLIQALQIDNVNLRTQNRKLWECVDYASSETLSERERTKLAEALVDVVDSEAMKRVVLQEERASEFHARLREAGHMIKREQDAVRSRESLVNNLVGALCDVKDSEQEMEPQANSMVGSLYHKHSALRDGWKAECEELRSAHTNASAANYWVGRELHTVIERRSLLGRRCPLRPRKSERL